MRWLLLAGSVLVSCAAPGRAPDVEVSTWGTMREVLREGRSGGRVDLAGPGSNTAVGVGALRDLAGEVTIVSGEVLVATAEGNGARRLRVREATEADAAALLVLADVPIWEARPLADCGSYDELEDRLAERLRARGVDPARPHPVRIRGRATSLRVHVVAGACPIADPSGPAPWRFEGPAGKVELVGFYVEGAAGRLTHHGRRSHLHAVAGDVMGHLDDVVLEDAVLLVPGGR